MAKPKKLATVYVDHGSIKPSESNPREINEDGIQAVAESIQRFGWQQPIVVLKKTGEIVAGETRWRAAALLNADVVPVVWFTGTRKEADAFMIADNKTGEFSKWEERKLAQLLESMECELEGTGHTEEDLQELLDRLEKESEKVESGTSSAVSGPAKTRKGDVFTMGKYELSCGASSHVGDVIIKRWQRATGEKAVRQDGRFFNDITHPVRKKKKVAKKKARKKRSR